jgi:uncharacterized membrane protein
MQPTHSTRRSLDRNASGSAETRSVSTARLEAFSDGVLAVAITLLVLDIRVPTLGPHESLAHALGQQWPHYAAFITSFITIGIIWINHHAMIGRLQVADHAILGLNLLLLMSIVILPFATSLMAAYLTESTGQHLAATVYGASLLLMAIMFTLLQRNILLSKPHMLRAELSEQRRRQLVARTITGLGPYVIATALAPLSAYLTLTISFVLAAYYAFPVASGGGQD